MDCYVYLHRKLSDGKIFYIGKGRGKRAWKKTQRTDWWKRVEAKHGRSVEIVLSGLTDEQAFDLERDLIDWVGLDNLCNLREGGEGGFTASAEAREIISKANKGKIVSQETREKIRKAATGKRHSEETKEKIREARLRQVMPPVSQKAREALAARMRGRVVSEETRAKISASKKGKKGHSWSEEQKARMREASLGRKHSKESIEKMRISSTGLKHSEETKAKMKKINQATNEKFKKPIECSNGMVFSFSGEAQDWLRENGFPTAQKTNIASCCTGKLKTAYGFEWKYHKIA